MIGKNQIWCTKFEHTIEYRCYVKIAGTSRGCKANSIESRASGQERVDCDEQGVPVTSE